MFATHREHFDRAHGLRSLTKVLISLLSAHPSIKAFVTPVPAKPKSKAGGKSAAPQQSAAGAAEHKLEVDMKPRSCIVRDKRELLIRVISVMGDEMIVRVSDPTGGPVFAKFLETLEESKRKQLAFEVSELPVLLLVESLMSKFKTRVSTFEVGVCECCRM